MYDLVRINAIIDDINRFFKDMAAIGLNESNIDIPEKLHSSSMLIFGIINRTIDLAQELIVKNELEMPATYAECFPILSKEGLIDSRLSKELESLIKKRGMFAHHYYSARKKEILQLSKDIYVVKEFVERVKKIVSGSFREL